MHPVNWVSGVDYDDNKNEKKTNMNNIKMKSKTTDIMMK